MRLLVFGGTKFLGRATVEAALARGHEVTLFNRGRTNPTLFPEAERLRGDRAGELSALEGRAWDAALDMAGYVPAVVRRSAEALRESVGRYLFVSSVSVYRDFTTGRREDDPRAELGDLPADELMPDYENYGALKALCEDAVQEIYGDRALIVRPGLIVGPHDPTGRFTYWPHRIARGGKFLVPGPPDGQVQFIDVRDLGTWMVELIERNASGAYNATHPGITWAELVNACLRVTGAEAEPVWIDSSELAARGAGEWMELPLWLHDPEWVGMNQTDASKALAAGLALRPVDDTIRGALEEAEPTADAGLTPEREEELLGAPA